MVWKEKEWKTLKNMLIYYNVMDCGPFVEAVGKMLPPYLAQGIDIFKSSFSASGVVKIQMLQRCEKEAFFCLFSKRHADLYHTLRSNITGGLSIVFTRLAIKYETKTRPHEISNPETCKKVIGLEANSLYLHAISQDLPCSLRRAEFKKIFVFFSNRKKKLPFVTKTLVLKFESN